MAVAGKLMRRERSLFAALTLSPVAVCSKDFDTAIMPLVKLIPGQVGESSSPLRQPVALATNNST